MVSQTLGTVENHNKRVRSAENVARAVDRARGDFVAFQATVTSSEEHLRDLWSMLNLRPTFNESFDALFTKQKGLCKVTRQLLDSLVSQYDRYLTLV